nr:metal ABC transporter substrate-binding protein [Synechococcus sp. RS9909]
MPLPMSLSLAALLLASSPAKPAIVAADGVLCDLTRTLVRDQASVLCLIPAGADPHTLSLRPADRRNLNKARLILINGYNLTPALNNASGGGPVVRVAEKAVPNSANNDPHVWHDPANTTAMVSMVASQLEPLMPAGGGRRIQQRRAAMTSVLQALGTWTTQQIQTVPNQQRVLVTGHRAFSAFAKRYGIRELPVIDDFTTGGRLRPASLSAISKAIQSSGTRAIFPESLPASKTMRRISRASGIPIAKQALVADGLAPGKSLIQTATANVCTFVDAQGGRCDTKAASQLQQRWAAIF